MRNLEINIYDDKKIIKTFNENPYDLRWRHFKKILSIVDMDNIKIGNDKEILKEIMRVLPKSIDVIETLIIDIFEGLTFEDLENALLKEIAIVVAKTLKHAILETVKGVSEKN